MNNSWWEGEDIRASIEIDEEDVEESDQKVDLYDRILKVYEKEG